MQSHMASHRDDDKHVISLKDIFLLPTEHNIEIHEQALNH